VLVTTATTGDGVPELVAALHSHRAAGHAAASTPAARLARAEAQVWAIVGERVRDRLSDARHKSTTDAVVTEVAEHRLDPYTAADRLLSEL